MQPVRSQVETQLMLADWSVAAKQGLFLIVMQPARSLVAQTAPAGYWVPEPLEMSPIVTQQVMFPVMMPVLKKRVDW